MELEVSHLLAVQRCGGGDDGSGGGRSGGGRGGGTGSETATMDQHDDGFSASVSWIRGTASHQRHLGVHQGDTCLGSSFDPGVIMDG